MTNRHPPDVDRRLREAFPDHPVEAARIARRALSAGGSFSRRRWATVAAGATVLVAAAAMVLWPAHPVRPPALQVATGSVTDGALVVTLPDGFTSISWGDVRTDRPPDGSGIVLVEGELR